MKQQRGRVPDYLESHVRKAYQPEHVRLDIDPEEVPNLKPGSANAPVRKFVNSPGPVLPKKNVPKGQQLPAQVGNHEDQMWFDDESFGKNSINNKKIKIKASDYIDNNDYIEVDKNLDLSRKNLRSYKETYAQVEDDVADYDSELDDNSDDESVEASFDKEVVEEHIPIEFPNVNEYLLIYDEKILLRTFDREEARQFITNLISREDIFFDGLVLIKRLSIDIGTILGD